VRESIRDEGFSAGSLQRPGLTRLRCLVQEGQIDMVVCTWYDRFTRSRDFYVLDREFKAHNVAFLTLHDRTDRHTASGRFMEMMLVAAKTYEREQTGEKVRSKHRMRAEKGMWNGGLVPFGFVLDEHTHVMAPDPDKSELLNGLFQLYVDTASDHAVRDWLKAHRVPSPSGQPVWATSTVRDLLCNRRYAGEIEINKANKGLTDLSEADAYRIVKAPHPPVVPLELFEIAQRIRADKADRHPNHRGKSRSYARRRPDHLYLLQGLMLCAECHSPMSPHYVFHKAGYGRRQDSFICHYVCARYKKYGKDCDHANRVLASRAEAWVVEHLGALLDKPVVLERAFEKARENCLASLHPQREALGHAQAALRENQEEIDRLVATMTGGGIEAELLGFLNGRARELKRERELLLDEQRRLQREVAPAEQAIDAHALRRFLTDFEKLAEAAEPQELQKVMRLAMQRVEWGPDGRHKLLFYPLPLNAGTGTARGSAIGATMDAPANQGLSKSASGEGNESEGPWFDLTAWSDTSGRGRTDTPLRELDFESSASANSATEARASYQQPDILSLGRPWVKPGHIPKRP
jgi:site-specific DNA recombinase